MILYVPNIEMIPCNTLLADTEEYYRDNGDIVKLGLLHAMRLRLLFIKHWRCARLPPGEQ